MASLDGAISAYRAALEVLPTQKVDDSHSKVISVLVARDRVAHTLSSNQSIAPEVLIRIAELDQRLKVSATAIDAIVGRSTLANWRETRQPPASAWWWSLDECAAATEPRPHPLWEILAKLFIITTGLSLTVEIARRFLGSGADFIGVFSTLASVLLALLGGSTFTEAGRKGVEHLLDRLGIGRKFYPVGKAGFALAGLIVVLALKLSLPTIARYYNDQGVRLQQDGQVTSAIENYQRAISLNPDYAEAHYSLATAYEDVLEYDKALSEYQTALRADPQLVLAYNNLARLYIRQRKDYDSAIYSLRLAEQRTKDDWVRFVIYKNLGWAHYEKELYHKAVEDLQSSLKLQHGIEAQNPPAALKLTETYRLLALAYEQLDQKAEAVRAWELSLGYADLRDPFEAEWAEEARSHLGKLRGESR